MGANGRAGRLLAKAFAQCSKLTVHTHARRGSHDLIWDPIAQSKQPFEEFRVGHRTLDAVFLFFGPGSHATPEELSVSSKSAVNAFKAAISANIPRVIIASTSAVYHPGVNLTESSPINPAGSYGTIKHDFEREIGRLDNGSANVSLLRIGNIAGADALLEQAVGNAQEGRISIDKFSDGMAPIRSYISPITLAKVLETLALYPDPIPPVLNVGATPPMHMLDLASTANLDWTWRDAPPEKAHLQRITLDCSLLAKLIGPQKLMTSPKAIIADLRQLGALS